MAAPLEGLLVVDLGWLMVGPVSARYLAELGAEVVKVETSKRPDPMRGLPPNRDGLPGLERSLSYHMINANKRSLAIDLKAPLGLEVVSDLISKADIFIESFTPGQVDGMGLSYAALRARNPRLIMVSTGILGRKGTMGLGMSGTGMTGSAYAGATNLLGWPDRPPTGPQGPWTDEVAPRFLVSSILAALHRRNATGAGTYIDLAQAEAGLQFLSPAYLDFAVNGVAPQRQWEAGSTLRAPSGVYPCEGEDRWLAIDASEHAAWRGLVDVVGPALATAQFGTLVARLRNREALDAVISGWTTKQDAVVLEQRLQNAGVPAHVVSQDLDIFQDSDLRHEGFYRQVSDPVIGEITIAGPQFRLVGTPQVETRAGPTIGDHAEEILARLCGRTPAEIEILKRSGVLV